MSRKLAQVICGDWPARRCRNHVPNDPRVSRKDAPMRKELSLCFARPVIRQSTNALDSHPYALGASMPNQRYRPRFETLILFLPALPSVQLTPFD